MNEKPNSVNENPAHENSVRGDYSERDSVQENIPDIEWLDLSQHGGHDDYSDVTWLDSAPSPLRGYVSMRRPDRGSIDRESTNKEFTDRESTDRKTADRNSSRQTSQEKKEQKVFSRMLLARLGAAALSIALFMSQKATTIDSPVNKKKAIPFQPITAGETYHQNTTDTPDVLNSIDEALSEGDLSKDILLDDIDATPVILEETTEVDAANSTPETSSAVESPNDYLLESDSNAILEADSSSSSWDGTKLSPDHTRNDNGPSGQETYYNLPMDGIVERMRRQFGIEGKYEVREDGVKTLDGYVMVAADLSKYPRGSIIETSLGPGIVCDTGSFVEKYPNRIDIATDWHGIK